MEMEHCFKQFCVICLGSKELKDTEMTKEAALDTAKGLAERNQGIQYGVFELTHVLEAEKVKTTAHVARI